MNKHNIVYFNRGVNRVAEWSDRAPDDDDRGQAGAITLSAQGRADEVTDEQLLTELVNKYDQWITDTRGPARGRGIIKG